MDKKYNFTDIYRLPLRLDYGGYVWSLDNVMSLTFELVDYDISFDKQKEIIDCLNSDSTTLNLNLVYDKNNALFKKDNKVFLHIRGWGYLTGKLNLQHKEAIEIQDTFASWLLTKLNTK